MFDQEKEKERQRQRTEGREEESTVTQTEREKGKRLWTKCCCNRLFCRRSLSVSRTNDRLSSEWTDERSRRDSRTQRGISDCCTKDDEVCVSLETQDE